MPSLVRPLTDADLPIASETLAAAFDEDPLFRYFLPKAARRKRWLRFIMSAALQQCMPDGGVFMAGEGADAAAMALCLPGSYPQPSGRLWGYAFRPSKRPGMPWPTWPLLRAGIPILGRMEKAHPKTEHIYIQVVGVSPERKGQGIGGRLMRYAIELAEERGVEIYLETSNEVNLGFYGRYGFEMVQEIESPGSAPPFWTMLRAAPEVCAA